jgi:DivIVA domain-containing protein
MMWFFAVLIVLTIGGVAVVASGIGDPLARVYDDRPDAVVPVDRPLTGADLKAIRFSTAVRGYRASEVDALLERLAAQLDGSTPPESGSGTLTP